MVGHGGARSGPGRAGGSDQTIAEEEEKELGETMARGPDRGGARSRAEKVGEDTELTSGVHVAVGVDGALSHPVSLGVGGTATAHLSASVRRWDIACTLHQDRG